MGANKKNAKTDNPNFLQRLQHVDATLSLPVFQISLPKPLEFLLSLPGNLNGPPALQFVAPSWYFLILEQDPNEISRRWLVALSLTTLFLILPFVLFLRGHVRMLSHVLYPNASFAVSPLLGTAFSYYQAPTPYASALGYYAIILYCLSCIVILFLKHWSRRLRPCVQYPHCVERKHFTIIPKILAKYSSFTSFPSGDAMGGAAFWGVPLVYLGYPKLSFSMVVFTALGRMYFLAHHLGDTLVGIGICVGIHAILGRGGAESMQWRHSILAWVALVAASLLRKGDEK